VAPSASQQSSTSHRPCFWQKAVTASRLKGVAQRVGQHHGLRSGAERGLELRHVDVVCGQIHVDEHRHRAELQDGIDRGGESRRDADHLVAPLNGAFAQLRRGERAEGHQIGARAAVDGEAVRHPQRLSQTGFEGGVETSGGEPAVEPGVHHVLQLVRANHLAAGRQHGLAWHEGALCLVGEGGVLRDEGADLGAQRLGLGLRVGGGGQRGLGLDGDHSARYC
jgi:hypothetical protein